MQTIKNFFQNLLQKQTKKYTDRGLTQREAELFVFLDFLFLAILFSCIYLYIFIF